MSVGSAPKARAETALDVLVVDDNESMRSAIVASLRSLGHACRAASDGDEGWAMFEARRPDVVISDWEMPGMNGAALCRKIRGSEDGVYTYFILMTGHHDRTHLLEGMAAGADDFQRKPIDFDELEARLVSAARVVALHRRIRRDSSALFAASRTDALTGVGNRLHMEEELTAAWSRARRYGHRFTLAIIDVDLFKQFNDSFGHLAGDEALRAVAHTLRSGLRAGDSVFRYGGEEFVVVLPEQGLAEGVLVVDRMRQALEARRIRHPEKERVLTFSAGVAELDLEVDEHIGAWIARADAALYAAKQNGRNRVEALSAARGVKNA